MRAPQQSLYPSSGYAWYTVGLLLVVYTFSFIDRQIVSLMATQLIEEFNLSNQQFGLLSGLSFALFYTITGLFCARIADRSSRTRLIAVGLALWSIMTALSGFARSYLQLFLYRMGVGIGEATLAPGANSLLADSFPKQKLSTALSVYAMGIPTGSALAFIIGGQVIELADQMPIELFGETLKTWQKSFLIVGIPGLILTFFVLSLKEPSRKGIVGDEGAMPFRLVLGYFMENAKAYSSIMLGVSFIAFIGFGSLLWLFRFFNLYHGLSPTQFGDTFGLIALVSGPIGLLFGGIMADRWFKQGKKDAHIRALLIAPLGFIVPATLFPFMGNLDVVWVLVFFSNMFINLPSGIAFAAIQIISPNQCRGQMVAAYVLLTNIIGYAGGSYFVGAVADLVAANDGVVIAGYTLLASEGLRLGMVGLGLIGMPLSVFFLMRGRQAFAKAVEAADQRESAKA